MARRPLDARHCALHALVLVALVACGSTDPPGGDHGPPAAGDELRLPKSFSAVIEPTGPHPLLPTEGFGRSVAISGARVAVADYLDWEYAGLDFPHVDLFQIVGGVAVPAGKLPEVGYGDLCFGEALALDGELLAVGEPCANAGAGEVHVYAWDGEAWVEAPPLGPAAEAGAARFGASLGMAANRMVVGAPREQAVAPGGAVEWGAGAAYVYSRSGGDWKLEARLVPDDVLGGDEFAKAVSMDASRIAAASPGRWNGDALGNPIGPNGKVYVYELQGAATWAEAAGLVFEGGLPGEWIGRTLALCSGTVFAGSNVRTWPAVHTFQLGPAGWIEGDLVDPAPPPNGLVDALACDGSVLVVGMPFASPPGLDWLGSARVYAKTGGTWKLGAELTGAAPGDRAGHAVAVDGSVVAVGVPSAVVDGAALGIVRVQRF